MDQIVVHVGLLAFFLVMSLHIEKSHPFRLFRKPICLVQAGCVGMGMVLGSLSFLYGTPSILMTVKRAAAVFGAIVTGGAVFHEKKMLLKAGAGTLVIGGLVLLFL